MVKWPTVHLFFIYYCCCGVVLHKDPTTQMNTALWNFQKTAIHSSEILQNSYQNAQWVKNLKKLSESVGPL
jgi:hypothetical protein